MLDPVPADRPTDACAAFRDAIDPVADGECDTLTTARVEAHAVSCASCHSVLETARARRARLRAVGDGERAPSGFRQQLQDLLRGVRGQWSS